MNRKQHIKADKVLLGYTIEPIHPFIDDAVKWLGAGHRIVKHGYPIVKAMKEIFGRRGSRVALLHILIDAKVLDREFIEDLLQRNDDGS